MGTFKLLALTKPATGREDEYNIWYDGTHVPEVLSIPGYKAAQRYKLRAPLMAGEASPYMAVYDIETDDIEALLKEVKRRAAAGEITQSDAVDSHSNYLAIYEEFGERRFLR